MVTDFIIQTTTCLTCNNELLKDLGKLQGVFGANIDRLSGKITISHTDEITPKQLQEAIEELGFEVKKV